MNPTNHQMWFFEGRRSHGDLFIHSSFFCKIFCFNTCFFKTMFGWVLGLVMRFEFPTSTPKIKNCKRSFHPFLLKGFSIQYHQLTAGMFAVCVRNVVKIRSTKNWCGNARLEQTRDFLKTLWLMTKELLRAVKLLNIFRWSGGLVPAASMDWSFGGILLCIDVKTHDFLLGYYQGWEFGPLGTTAKKSMASGKLMFFFFVGILFLCNANI